MHQEIINRLQSIERKIKGEMQGGGGDKKGDIERERGE